MDELDPISMFELCFPGAVTGSTEVTCPHCDCVLTIPVDDPMARKQFQCAECDGIFIVDLGERTIHWDPDD